MGRLVAILVLLATWGCASAAAVDVRAVRLVDGGGQTRLELDLSGPCTHSVFPMHKPERLVIDIPDATLRGRLPLAPGDHPTLAGLRSGVRAGDDLRMVLDIKQAVRTKTFLRKPGAEGGHRLVIDLIPTAPSAPPPAKTTAPKEAQKAKAPEGQGSETQVKAPEPKVLETRGARTKGGKTKGRTLVIAIDPGHGGKDPGAIGPKGTREKDITLAIAKRLAALVAKEPGMRPYLTRDKDSFVPLRKRMSKARAEGADLFISIHADAFEDAAVRICPRTPPWSTAAWRRRWCWTSSRAWGQCTRDGSRGPGSWC